MTEEWPPQLNRDRIIALAKLIYAQPHTNHEAVNGFSMISFAHKCGTPSCIAGWAAAGATGRTDIMLDDVPGIASKWLGLTPDHERDLFYPVLANSPNAQSILVDLTPKQAHDVLMNLAETGKVDLSVAGYKRTEYGEWELV